MISLMISQGGDGDDDDELADVNVADMEGDTAMWTACGQGLLDLAQSLLAKGAKVDDQDLGGVSCLHVASHHGGSLVIIVDIVVAVVSVVVVIMIIIKIMILSTTTITVIIIIITIIISDHITCVQGTTRWWRGCCRRGRI
jgi:hypothetical protein